MGLSRPEIIARKFFEVVYPGAVGVFAELFFFAIVISKSHLQRAETSTFRTKVRYDVI